VSISAASLKVGDSKEQLLVDDLTRTQIVMYAGASGDYNPLHSDEKFAREVAGYPGIFAHGMLTMGMTGKLLTDTFGVANMRKYGVRFTSQVFPGDSLDATATVTEIIDEGGDQLGNGVAEALRCKRRVIGLRDQVQFDLPETRKNRRLDARRLVEPSRVDRLNDLFDDRLTFAGHAHETAMQTQATGH